MSSPIQSEIHERQTSHTLLTASSRSAPPKSLKHFEQQPKQQLRVPQKFAPKDELSKEAQAREANYRIAAPDPEPDCGVDKEGEASEFMDDGDYSSSTTSNRILTAVRDAATANKQLPVPVYSIQQELKAVHPFTRLKGDRLLKCLEREVKNGRLQKAAGSSYTLAVQLVTSDTANATASRTSSLRRSSKRQRTSRWLYTDYSPPQCRSSKAGRSQCASHSQSLSDAEEDTSDHTEPPTMSRNPEAPWESDAHKVDDKDQTDSTVRKSSRVRHQPKKFQSLNHMATQRRARKRARYLISKSLCSECQSNTTPHDDDAEGVLLKCAKCKYAVHRSCSGFRETTWEKLQEGIYHCLECKRCSGCDTGKCGDTDTVLCIECDGMFHYDCHMPNVKDAPNGWTCSKCRPSSVTPFVRPASPVSLEPNEKTSPPSPSRALPVIKISNEGGRTTVLKYYPENENRAKTDLGSSSVYNRIVKADNTGLNTTPSSGTSNIPPYPLDAFLSHMAKTFPTFAGHTKSIDPVLGDLKDLTVYQILSKKTDSGSHVDNSKITAKNVNKIETWSSELIAESLKKKGHEEFADVIRKHMIDGQSLLHLVRDDVVNRFGLPLGPAVKMWRELCDFASWLD